MLWHLLHNTYYLHRCWELVHCIDLDFPSRVPIFEFSCLYNYCLFICEWLYCILELDYYRNFVWECTTMYSQIKIWYSASCWMYVLQSINRTNFNSANIPGEARLSGATAKSVFNSKIEETVPSLILNVSKLNVYKVVKVSGWIYCTISSNFSEPCAPKSLSSSWCVNRPWFFKAQGQGVILTHVCALKLTVNE